MEIHDNFIVYNRPAAAIKRGQGTNLMPLTPGGWQEEMLDQLSLYDRKEATFSKPPVNAQKQESCEKPETSPAEAKVDVKQTSARKLSGKKAPNREKMDDVIDKTSGQLNYGTPVTINESKKMIASRGGKILGEGMILKADQFPGIHRLGADRDQVVIPGAPNYRKTEGEPIHGTAQPTVEGIENTLRQVGSSGQKIVWTNTREEPVIYIKGRPFNLRKLDDRFRNLDQKGIEPEKLEEMENKLRDEILDESKNNGGYLLVQDEVKYFDNVQNRERYEVVPRKVKITEDDVKTTRQVFDEMRDNGFNVDYARVPITDEKRPQEEDFDALVDRVRAQGPDAQFVFNCHMGRGRTTTSMVAASLTREALTGKKDQSIIRNESVREEIRESGDYRMGEYKVILSTIKAMESGPSTKQEVDEKIDKYSALTNLRESILDNREKSISSSDGRKSSKYEEKGKDYLERYFYLINFNAYLKEQAPAFNEKFGEWMDRRPEQKKMLENFQLAMGTSPVQCGGEKVNFA